MATTKSSNDATAKSLASTLSSVAKVAKSLGIDTRKAESMVAQTKAEGSKAYKGSSYEKSYNASILNSQAIEPQTPITLPTPKPQDGMFGVMDTNNAALAGLGGANYDTGTKQITPATQETGFQNILSQYLNANQAAYNDVPSQENLVKEQQKFLRPKENLVNSLQNQLNTISKNRDAAILALEGQGRGIPSSIIGGQQAKISREAAINSLGLQSQLAAAQDDLDSARSYASQLFQAKTQDALARYNYQREVNSTIFNYLNDAQQRTLAATQREQDRQFQLEQSKYDDLKQLSFQALSFGQSALAGEIMNLDPKSPTFQKDYGDAISRLRNPVAATKQKLDTGFDNQGNLINMQTGELIRAAADANAFPGGAAGAQQYETQKADIQTGIQTAQSMLENTSGLNLSTGAYQSPLAKTLLQNVGGTTAAFTAAGSVVPGIGTLAGLGTGLAVGAVTAPFAYSANKNAQSNFLAGASFLINDSTFAEIRNLRAQGVTFGNMTEGERIAAGRAATNLASAAIIDESGQVTGFRGDANTIKGYVQDILTAYQGRQEYLDRAYSITPDEESQAALLWGSK